MVAGVDAPVSAYSLPRLGVAGDALAATGYSFLCGFLFRGAPNVPHDLAVVECTAWAFVTGFCRRIAKN
jgi:hypothetical protein